MARWSYKVLTYNNSAHHNNDESLGRELSRLGEDGWELVSAAPEVSGNGTEGDVQISSNRIKFIFKKEL